MDPDRALEHRLANALQTTVLLGAMAGLAGYLGWTLLGTEGLVWAALVVTLAMALGANASPRLVLRLAGAVELAPWQAPAVHGIVAELADRAGLPRVPRLYYVPTRVLNAFAVGRRQEAAIALTDAMLRTLSRRELAGVLAHEIAHLRANDVWVMMLADAVARMTSLLSVFGALLLVLLLPLAAAAGVQAPFAPLVVMMLAPLAASLLQLALSRTREYAADIVAAELTGDPRGLAHALDKLERLQGGWIERLFFARGPRWLHTHPDIHSRIRRLLALERRQPILA